MTLQNCNRDIEDEYGLIDDVVSEFATQSELHLDLHVARRRSKVEGFYRCVYQFRPVRLP